MHNRPPDLRDMQKGLNPWKTEQPDYWLDRMSEVYLGRLKILNGLGGILANTHLLDNQCLDDIWNQSVEALGLSEVFEDALSFGYGFYRVGEGRIDPKLVLTNPKAIK